LVELHVLDQQEIDAVGGLEGRSLALNGAMRYQNISDVDNYGYNASLRGSVLDGHLSYGVNGTAAYTRSRYGGEKRVLPVAPQLFGNSFVAYKFADDLPTPALAVQYVGERLIDRAYELQWAESRYVAGMVRWRGTLTGRVPRVNGLEYRLSATYSTASEGPYVVGLRPYSRMTPAHDVYTNPVDRFTAFVGLSYQIGGEDTNEVAP
jgi:hypothetical protein